MNAEENSADSPKALAELVDVVMALLGNEVVPDDLEEDGTGLFLDVARKLTL